MQAKSPFELINTKEDLREAERTEVKQLSRTEVVRNNRGHDHESGSRAKKRRRPTNSRGDKKRHVTGIYSTVYWYLSTILLYCFFS
jgi:hypothetical protein